MFLTNLTKEQKTAFLGLAHAVAVADGVLSSDEDTIMGQYKAEMAMPDDQGEKPESVERAVDTFKEAAMTIKKQVVFELVALACTDNKYETEEDHLLREIIQPLGIDDVFLDESKKDVFELTDLYKRIGDLVNE